MQKAKLEDFAKKYFSELELISDLGSGLKYKKLAKTHSRRKAHPPNLIINQKDRLVRFGSKVIFCFYREIN